MSTPKKKAGVTKRPSAEQILDAKKWNEFVTASQTEWDELSDEWKDVFDIVGNTKYTSDEINQAILKAMGVK